MRITYQCWPEDRAGVMMSERVLPIAPDERLFHQEEMEQAVLVYAYPFASVPFHVVVLDQHLENNIFILLIVHMNEKFGKFLIENNLHHENIVTCILWFIFVHF